MLNCFSAIARSVMISALVCDHIKFEEECFSAIARSVMISAMWSRQGRFDFYVSVL